MVSQMLVRRGRGRLTHWSPLIHAHKYLPTHGRYAGTVKTAFAGHGNFVVSDGNTRSEATRPAKHYPVCIVGGGPSGLFLSILLTEMGVSHCLIEQKAGPTAHPQAHFINNRSMELLQSHCNRAFQAVVKNMPPSEHWRDFVYCYSVTGREFARVDHFSPDQTDPSYLEMSPTTCVHLPQNQLESILRAELARLSANKPITKQYFGYKASSVQLQNTSTTSIMVNAVEASANKQTISVSADLLIGADGAHSAIRRLTDIKMTGTKDMQSLLNIQFTCTGLNELLRKPRPAMLYFTFNETAVAVFVAHNSQKDEWVCQLPIFPPFQHAQVISCVPFVTHIFLV
jgi:2-polyprenyl-6-methoxyphenol hydroxylase-like FAD-dependent oxidoreductase